jgi:multiple sugar transport system permease protein
MSIGTRQQSTVDVDRATVGRRGPAGRADPAIRQVLTPIASRGGWTAGVGDRLLGYGLLAPALAALVVFVAAPALLTIVVALFRWNLLARTQSWVGFENYNRVLGSDEFTNAVKNTVLYTLMTVPITVGLGLLVAVAINSVRRARALWRAIYFLPVASTLVATAVVWRWLFFPETGPVDSLLGTSGWLRSTSLALPALAIVGNWQGLGFAMVIFLAGLSSVPRHLLEAAELDGAGPLARFRHVTWPALGPATVFAVVVATTTSLRLYDSVAVMTQGGPLSSTETLTYLIWRRGIDYLDLGGGAVITVALLILVLIVTVWQFRLFGRRLESGAAR